MKRNKWRELFLTVVLCTAVVLSVPQGVYGGDYTAGQSLVAEDQVKASRGLSFPGLDITWLDFGEDHLLVSSPMPNQYSEGIFTMQLPSALVCFDTSGRVITVGEYNDVGRFSDGMALVTKYLPHEQRSGMAPPPMENGYINKEGKEVISVGKLSGLHADFHEGLAVIGDYDQKKGYIDKSGEIVIPQIYRMAGDFSQGLAPVQSAETELWGYIDPKGELVIPMEFEAAEPFREDAAYVVKSGLAGYIDKAGKTVIDFRFPPAGPADRDRSFYGGLAVATNAAGKYGYIDKSGSFVIEAKYREADPFTGEVAFVSSENSAYLNGAGSSFLINRQGERITPLWGYSVYSGETMESGLFRVLYPSGTDPNQSIAMINQYGAEVISPSLGLGNISPFNEGVALLIDFRQEGKMAVGLVKKPENVDEKKAGRLIKVFLDGKQLDFADTDPVIENSRTLVPMRAIFESLGAQVGWDEANSTASGTKEGTTVSLKIGENRGYVNGEAVELDAPAKIQNARTLVPLRFITESLQGEVTWDDAARTVNIVTKNKIADPGIE